jgi:hypothetical protein
LPALSIAVPRAIDWRFPAPPVALKNVHVPVPRSHVPAETPPQFVRTTSAAGAVAPAPTIAQEIGIVVAGPALADPTAARQAVVTIDRVSHSRRSIPLLLSVSFAAARFRRSSRRRPSSLIGERDHLTAGTRKTS